MSSNESFNEQKRKRITKKELYEFLDWAFNHTDDKMNTITNIMIATMYVKETGRYISLSTVRSNRDCWRNINGGYVKVTR